MKELVSLREKQLANGVRSLYLDYTIGGRRTKEYLKMYLVPELKKVDRLQNQETMKTAIAIRAKRTIDLQNGISGFVTDGGCMLLDYLNDRQEYYARRGQQRSALIIRAMSLSISKYSRDIRLTDINKPYLMEWVANMQKELTLTTIQTYFAFLSTQLKTAVRDGLIAANPIDKLSSAEKPHRTETIRQYLTMDELNILMRQPVRKDVAHMRDAFFFSCFTGLRWVDIRALTWDNIETSPAGEEIVLRQHKTKASVRIPLSDNARRFMPERTDNPRVFYKLAAPANVNSWLYRWVPKAGIKKHISFHCARHTFATLLLTNDVDIYTTSKLLGHSDIKTTQIYAKVVDEKKVRAINAIPSLKG